MDELEAGSKVNYRLYDKKGKEHWLPGVIHAVRRIEDPATNAIIKMTYLVDTGRNTAVDKYPYDPRDREINKRVGERVRKSGTKKLDKIVAEVLSHDDLPDSEMLIEEVRQPEQIELEASHIRRA